MARLKDKTALITGGTSGIGLETARRFVAEGARVAVTGQRAETVAAAAAELGSAVLVLRSDAGDAAQQSVLAETLRQHFGTLDCVFINAGMAVFSPFDSLDEATFDRQMAINVKGPYFLVQALLPILANPSSIVLNASINAHIGMPMSSAYAASKAALLSLARTWSGELLDRGVRVNAISPGPVDTPIFTKLGMAAEQLEATAEAIRQQVPLKRFGKPIEIANAAVFLASDESQFMLGSEIIVDGGMSTL